MSGEVKDYIEVKELITQKIFPRANSTTAIQIQNASNTNILNVDTTNSRVGIGTAGPVGTLDVQRPATGALGTVAQFRDSEAAGNALGIRTNAGLVDLVSTWNDTGANIDLSFTPTTTAGVQTEAMRIKASNGYVGVMTTSPASPLHVDQSSATGAVPVLTLDQGDDDQDMIEFIGTIGTGNAIEAVGAKTLTTTHFIKVTLPGGLIRYFPVGTIA